ncbi:MAG: alkylhydroperoxidase [Solirubrobacterales bacterium]|nr:alkylhydroperoxidase [Solirubrobacterales bacterium]
MRLEPLTPQTAEGKAREALADVYEHHGEAGPMVRAMANSPALLRGYLDLSRATKRIALERSLAERISIAVQAELGCDYCLAAHSESARELGVGEEEIEAAGEARSPDPRVEVLLDYAVGVLRSPGTITDQDIERLRVFGHSDRQIADVIALVALNQLTGSFNLVAGTRREREAESEAPAGETVREAA